ncbi:MAG: transcriptional regulator [bacterium]
MQNKAQKLIKFFRDNGGTVRFSSILNAGFHSDLLVALEKEKKVKRVARGLYRLDNYVPMTNPDIINASLQAPRGVVCLLSALSFYEVTTEVPEHIDMAILRGSHAYRIKYPPVRFYRFDSKSYEAGVEERKIDGCRIKVYNLAKTLADCCKFRNKIGMNIVREALKVAIKEKNIKPKEIMQYAKICRVDNIIKPILEAML